MRRFLSAAALALAAIGLAPAFGQVAPPIPAPEAAPSRQPLLWRSLRAGMSPAEVAAALRAEGIRADLRIDRDTGRHFVEAPGAVEEAGRPAQMAFGFVNDGLYYVEINSQRVLASRIPFDRSHFTHVAALLSEQFGPPLTIDASPIVSEVSHLGFVSTARARFEYDGVRVDLAGYDTYATFQRDVVEVVDVRYWRIADAEAFDADRRRIDAAKPH
jgi:hypothetical protein